MPPDPQPPEFDAILKWIQENHPGFILDHSWIRPYLSKTLGYHNGQTIKMSIYHYEHWGPGLWITHNLNTDNTLQYHLEKDHETPQFHLEDPNIFQNITHEIHKIQTQAKNLKPSQT